MTRSASEGKTRFAGAKLRFADRVRGRAGPRMRTIDDRQPLRNGVVSVDGEPSLNSFAKMLQTIGRQLFHADLVGSRCITGSLPPDFQRAPLLVFSSFINSIFGSASTERGIVIETVQRQWRRWRAAFVYFVGYEFIRTMSHKTGCACDRITFRAVISALFFFPHIGIASFFRASNCMRITIRFRQRNAHPQ